MIPKYFVDVSTLLEPSYTGISNVNYHTAKYFSRYESTVFYNGSHIVSSDFVHLFLEYKSGAHMHHLKATQSQMVEHFTSQKLDARHSQLADEVTVGISSNVKTVTGVFDFEAQWIYDLTYLIVPNFHHANTIKYHGEAIQSDIETSDLLLCISEHTKRDLVDYLKVPKNKCQVVPLASTSVIASSKKTKPKRPYFLMVGTIEPRKNYDLVLKMISENRSWAEGFDFIFCGRDGWHVNFGSMLKAHKLENAKNIQRFDFVEDEFLSTLYKNASALIFSSWYEGYGLPIVEAFSHQCPVVSSFSSSMPEVGGSYAEYFNPNNVAELLQACQNIIERYSTASSRKQLEEYASKRTWNQVMREVEAGIINKLDVIQNGN